MNVFTVIGPHGDGVAQMATDVAMARLAEREDAAVVRVYRFEPPTVSLGRFQDVDDVYLPGLREIGAGLCRRPTGGQAVLHDDEVTYAVAAPRHRLPENVIESYRRIAEGIVGALRRLGVPAEATVRPGELRREANCFLWPAPAEITVAGRKLVGSAQCRLGGAFLQHGSVPLRIAYARWAAVFAPPAEREAAAARMRRHAVSVSEAAGRTITWDEVAAVLLPALAEVFGRTPEPLPVDALAGLAAAEDTRRFTVPLSMEEAGVRGAPEGERP